jgi:hypothetical protein
MKKVINIKFREGEQVVLRTDPGVIRVVSGYLIRGRDITYGLTKGDDEGWFRDVDIAKAGNNVVVKGFR